MTAVESVAVQSAASDERTQDLVKVLDVLGFEDDEVLCVAAVTEPGKPESFQRKRGLVGRLRKNGVASLLDRGTSTDLYLGFIPLLPNVTGTDAASARRIMCLWADLDDKPRTVHPKSGKPSGGMGSRDKCQEVIEELSAILGQKPVAVIMSGHGLQPLWLIEDATAEPQNLTRCRKALRRFGMLVKLVANVGGGHADSVFDPARVLRMPGSINHKDPAHPVPVEVTFPGGAPLSIEEIEDALDAYVIPASPPEEEPQHHSASGWRFSASTCAYVRGMLKGWPTDEPSGGRHHWGYSGNIRLHAAKRLGCITEAHLAKGLEVLQARMTELRAADGPSAARPREVALDVRYAVAKVEAKTDDECWAELGGDQHRDWHAEQEAADEDDEYSSAASTPAQSGPQLGAGAPADSVAAIPLAEADRIFIKWLGPTYDLDAMHAALAAVAVERLDGDPLWLLIIGGSANAKTETVVACGFDGTATSTIASAGALLSATGKRQRAKTATGGLLRQVGPRGVLVVKDVTSVLSMDRTARAEVLAALREVYDGRWDRAVGTDGGMTLSWAGRLAVLGAVTTAWDTAHSVISAMGDRFVLIRLDSTEKRVEAGRQAIGNTGEEAAMRAELRAACAGVIAGLTTPSDLTSEESERLLAAADLVTRCRTGVEYDYQGNVIDCHALEMPTRFAKQLAQVVRGGLAIGLSPEAAMALAIRAARDSMPPLRLLIIDDLVEHPGSSAADVRKRIGKPWRTVDRQLQALQMLGALDVDEDPITLAGKQMTRWLYTLSNQVTPGCLRVPPVARNVGKGVNGVNKEGEREDRPASESATPHAGTNISGDVGGPGGGITPSAQPEPDQCSVCGQEWSPIQANGRHAICERGRS